MDHQKIATWCQIFSFPVGLSSLYLGWLQYGTTVRNNGGEVAMTAASAALVAPLFWAAIGGFVALSVMGLALRIFGGAEITPTPSTPSSDTDVVTTKTDRELALWFTHQAEDAIREIRDKQGASVKTLNDLVQLLKAAGRWFGRTEYVAEQLRTRYPNEVSAFVMYGGGLKYPVNIDEILTHRNHLQALITVKVENLRTLAQVIAR